ncbi:hypothetical protein BT96DRAFT_878637, partial [Gymnopus androsaceus JB14]
MNPYLGIYLGSFTMLYYDYFLTLGREVNLFWMYPSFACAPVLFYLSRYLSLLGSIPVMISVFLVSDVKVCRRFQTYHQYYALVLQVLIGALLLLRTYALYERSVKILVTLLVVGLVAVLFGIVVLVLGRNDDSDLLPVLDHVQLCTSQLSRPDALCLAAVWGGMLFYDALVFSLTLYKTLNLQRNGRVTLLSVLMRDGTI